MSRTLKRYPEGGLRNPKGHRQAIVRDDRAVPPDPWEDIQHDKQCFFPFKVAVGMAKNLVPREEIVRHLMKKFGLRLGRAEEVVEATKWIGNKVPAGCLAVAKEKRCPVV